MDGASAFAVAWHGQQDTDLLFPAGRGGMLTNLRKPLAEVAKARRASYRVYGKVAEYRPGKSKDVDVSGSLNL